MNTTGDPEGGEPAPAGSEIPQAGFSGQDADDPVQASDAQRSDAQSADAQSADALASDALASDAQSADAQADTAQGDTAQGDTAQGDTAQGDTAQGDTAQGDTAQGDTARADDDLQAEPGQAGPDDDNGYGYGPGYGGPGYGYGPSYSSPGSRADMPGADMPGAGMPGDGLPVGAGYPPPAAASIPLQSSLPVVAATPALRGYPGGPGIEIPENGPASREQHNLNTPSAWQFAQRAWRDSGVEWQRSAAEWEPAEVEWDRIQPGLQARRRGTGAQPKASSPAGGISGKFPASKFPASKTLAGKTLAGKTLAGKTLAARTLAGKTLSKPRSGRPHVRRGVWQAAIAVIVVVVLVLAGVLIFGGGGAKSARSASVAKYPPARPAGTDFSADPALRGRGIFQSLSGVAASGGTIVAVGRERGEWIPRAQFLVSVDGGQSWRLAPVHSAGGKAPPPGPAPNLIAGGAALAGAQGGWLALGPGATWTSRDGRSWLLAAGKGIGPLLGGDQVAALARTGSGFLAVGENVPRAHAAKSSTASRSTASRSTASRSTAGSSAPTSSPVIWTSPNGLSWQRLSGRSLRLTAPGGQVVRVTAAAAHGSDVIIQGVIARAVHGTSRHRAGGGLAVGAWRSGDDGATWAPAHIPLGAGAGNTIEGVAATSSELVVIRPGDSKKTGPDAVAYTSRGGAIWSRAGTIPTTAKDDFHFTAVSGSDQGIAVSGQIAGRAKVAYESSDGRSWHRVANLGSAKQGLAGITVTTGGSVVAAGGTVRRPESQQPYLVLAGTQATTVSFGDIQGAGGPALTVNGIAAAGSQRVAVGSANGLPAIWLSPRGGGFRPVVSGVLATPGLGTLGDVVHGPDGWLAVGGITAVAPRHPVVAISPDATGWQAVQAESAFAGPGINLYQAAAGRRGYVIAGRQVIPARTVSKTSVVHGHKKVTTRRIAARTVAAAWWSAGLTGWIRAGNAGAGDLNGPGVRQMPAVTAGGPGFVGVGSVNHAPAVWTSSDGRHWQLTGLRVPAGASAATLNKVAAIGNLIVAAGKQATAAGSLPFAEFSADGGAIWQQVPLRAPGGATSVTALITAGHGFIMLGTAGQPGSQRVVVWTSPGGSAWKAQEPPGAGLSGPGTQAITALTASGSSLIGAGFSASPAGEQPMLWKATAGSG